jgi:hypothetical protein
MFLELLKDQKNWEMWFKTMIMGMTALMELKMIHR